MVLGFILAPISCAAIAEADDANTTAGTAAATNSRAGVLLLEDGGVLEGEVTRIADRYVVGRDGGQQMQIASSRVLFVGRSLREAYEYRRQRVSQPTAGAHLGLAEWCLRYELVNEGRDELQYARQAGASPARLALLERRLAATRERLAKKPAAPTAAGSVAFPSDQTTPPAGPSRDLPDGALEMFTRKVQPVLVNNCTASKCHQPGGQQAFQLNRALLRGEANRRTTMQNLAATLALVDRSHPEVSPLLTIPRQTHGGMGGPIFGARHEQAFKHLADWVALVAPPKSPSKATDDPLTSPEVVTAAAITSAKLSSPVADVQVPPTGEAAPIDAPTDAEPIESLRTPHRLQYGATLEEWKPRDPFDPEIFNRRHHSRAPSPTVSAGSSATPATDEKR
jgi:hypothetical protein